MLSQATASVTSGLSSVIETVETSLGVPDPQEMARKVKAEEKAVKQKQEEEEKNMEVTRDDKNAEGKNGREQRISTSKLLYQGPLVQRQKANGTFDVVI